MNLNIQVQGVHFEYEPNTYYASFSGELEASASPMWAMVSHIKPNTSKEYSENIIRHCLTALREWMKSIKFTNPNQVGLDLFHKISFIAYPSILLRLVL